MTEARPQPSPNDEPRRASRGRVVLARALTVVGVLLVVVSLLANYVEREALDESTFRETSRELIADDAVREQLAATLVEELYASVDVSAALEDNLPQDAQGLAGPLAGIARAGLDRAARELLERPRVQELFVNASSLAQRQFVAVLEGETRALETTGGDVVLDVRPIVLELGNRFSFIPNLEDRVPPEAGKVTVLESESLERAQDATKALRFVATWIWVLAIAAWAAAIWLAVGRRRIEVRAISVGLIVAGLLVLVIRALAGRYVVDELVVSSSVRPAVSNAYEIITDLLRGAGWTAVIVGLVALVWVWLAGPRPRSVSARAALAPHLRRPELAYGAFVVGYLLLLWWRPTPQFAFPRNVVVFFLLAVVGLETLRRMATREFPDAEPGDSGAAVRGAIRSIRGRGGPQNVSTELEQLAGLHASGALDDVEYAAAKARVLGT